MWSCLNFPSLQSDWDLRPPHNTECVVEVTQLKPQFTLRKPIKAEVNLRAVCLSRCRAVIACLAEILSQVQVFFFFYCVAAGFDLMAYFSVKEILGTREDDGQSSYVRLGTVPIVQQTE